jgi:hypothetical protein
MNAQSIGGQHQPDPPLVELPVGADSANEQEKTSQAARAAGPTATRQRTSVATHLRTHLGTILIGGGISGLVVVPETLIADPIRAVACGTLLIAAIIFSPTDTPVNRLVQIICALRKR